jgi:hypothetical protein
MEENGKEGKDKDEEEKEALKEKREEDKITCLLQ